MEPDKFFDPDSGWTFTDHSNDDLIQQINSAIHYIDNNNSSAAPYTGIGWSTTPINNHTVINGPISSNEMTVPDGAGGFIKVGDALRKIMERLAILEPDLAKMERYPALKAAYDNYKIMEALLNEEAAGKK